MGKETPGEARENPKNPNSKYQIPKTARFEAADQELKHIDNGIYLIEFSAELMFSVRLAMSGKPDEKTAQEGQKGIFLREVWLPIQNPEI
jgi:hypothetical protein